MSELETRYRSALRWYPRSWRQDNEEVVIGTLMDEADVVGRVRPRRSELASLAINGLGTRFARAVIISRRARDRFAALSFGTGFALMAVMFFGDEWAPLTPNRFSDWAAGFGPFLSAAVVVNLLWMAAFVLALIGLERWARGALIVAIAASLAAVALIDIGPMFWARPPASALALLIVLAFSAIAGRPRRRSLIVCGIASSVMFVAFVYQQDRANSWAFGLHEGWMIAANGWWAIALFAAAGLLVAIRRVEWVAPVTASAVLWALYSIFTSVVHRPNAEVLIFGLLAVIAAVAVLALVSLPLRGYRLQVDRMEHE